MPKRYRVAVHVKWGDFWHWNPNMYANDSICKTHLDLWKMAPDKPVGLRRHRARRGWVTWVHNW